MAVSREEVSALLAGLRKELVDKAEEQQGGRKALGDRVTLLGTSHEAALKGAERRIEKVREDC